MTNLIVIPVRMPRLVLNDDSVKSLVNGTAWVVVVYEKVSEMSAKALPETISRPRARNDIFLFIILLSRDLYCLLVFPDSVLYITNSLTP